MSRLFFSEPKELFPIFDEGVRIILQSGEAPTGTYTRLNAAQGERIFSHVIRMRSQEPFNRKNAPWDTTPLEEVKVTLVHELLHAFRIRNGRESAFQATHSQIEIDIDRFAYEIVRVNPHWVDDILSELVQRSNCRFDYQVSRTVFRRYHRLIVGQLLEGMSSRLCIGDERQLSVLRWARTLNISLPATL